MASKTPKDDNNEDSDDTTVAVEYENEALKWHRGRIQITRNVLKDPPPPPRRSNRAPKPVDRYSPPAPPPPPRRSNRAPKSFGKLCLPDDD